MYALILEANVPLAIKNAISHRNGTILDFYKSLPAGDHGEEVFTQEGLRFSNNDTFWVLTQNNYNSDRTKHFLRYSIYRGIYGYNWSYGPTQFYDGATGLELVISEQMKDDILTKLDQLTTGTLAISHFSYIQDDEVTAIRRRREEIERKRVEAERMRIRKEKNKLEISNKDLEEVIYLLKKEHHSTAEIHSILNDKEQLMEALHYFYGDNYAYLFKNKNSSLKKNYNTINTIIPLTPEQSVQVRPMPEPVYVDDAGEMNDWDYERNMELEREIEQEEREQNRMEERINGLYEADYYDHENSRY